MIFETINRVLDALEHLQKSLEDADCAKKAVDILICRLDEDVVESIFNDVVIKERIKIIEEIVGRLV